MSRYVQLVPTLTIRPLAPALADTLAAITGELHDTLEHLDLLG
ncbi:hypothetical protein [Micromonospora sp. DT47]